MDEREEFEEWIAKTYYVSLPTNVVTHLWAGWRARAALGKVPCEVCDTYRRTGDKFCRECGRKLKAEPLICQCGSPMQKVEPGVWKCSNRDCIEALPAA